MVGCGVILQLKASQLAGLDLLFVLALLVVLILPREFLMRWGYYPQHAKR